jgi:hypothetical protein
LTFSAGNGRVKKGVRMQGCSRVATFDAKLAGRRPHLVVRLKGSV